MRKLDEQLVALTISIDEWETLYRERLQLERDLLAARAGTTASDRDEAGAQGAAVPTGHCSRGGRIQWCARRFRARRRSTWPCW